MPRYKLTIEYDGRGLVGWQRQENGPSVQQAIEEAIGKFSGETVRVHGAGRTDAGVHALGQVAHVDLVRAFEADTVRDAVNFHLKPAAISVLAAALAPDEFHARLSARSRAYLYRIVNRRAPLALDQGRAWHVMNALDAEAMGRAAQRLIGRHDFTTFRASLCQAKSPVKTLDVLGVVRQGEEVLGLGEEEEEPAEGDEQDRGQRAVVQGHVEAGLVLPQVEGHDDHEHGQRGNPDPDGVEEHDLVVVVEPGRQAEQGVERRHPDRGQDRSPDRGLEGHLVLVRVRGRHNLVDRRHEDPSLGEPNSMHGRSYFSM